jgi:hypothetical protein
LPSCLAMLRTIMLTFALYLPDSAFSVNRPILRLHNFRTTVLARLDGQNEGASDAKEFHLAQVSSNRISAGL